MDDYLWRHSQARRWKTLSSKRGNPWQPFGVGARGHFGVKGLMGLHKINAIHKHPHVKYSCSVTCKPPHVSTLAWHKSCTEIQSPVFPLILVNWFNETKENIYPGLFIWISTLLYEIICFFYFFVWKNLN